MDQPAREVPSSKSRWKSLPDQANSIGALIAVFTLVRLLLALAVPLLPQEAYYWSWSRHLDWSYFDHPPMVAYSIALTTAVFGQTIFGIKLAAVLWSLGWNLIWARLILDMFADRRLAFWSVLALNLTIAYEIFGVGPTPDGPLIFGWVGTVWAIWRAGATGNGRWWYAAGLFAGIAMLGKYSAVLLLPVGLLYLVTSPRQRHWLRKPQPYLALLIAAALFIPVLVWNAQHEWASFAFQGSRRLGQMGGFKPRNFVVLLATQMLMATPYLFVVSIAVLARGTREWFSFKTDDRARLLLLSAAVPLILFTAISFRSVVKLNWLAPAYWSLIILGMHHILQRGSGMRRLIAGLASSAALVAMFMVLVATPNVPVVGDLNSWSGWREAAQGVERVSQTIRREGQQSFVFSPKYKISSLLRFYLPGQPRTYAQDIYGARALQFDYFPLEADLKGATGILVVSDQAQSRFDRARLKPYFDSVELAEVVETVEFGRVIRRIEIYRCSNYRGHPQRTDDALTGRSGQPAPDADQQSE